MIKLKIENDLQELCEYHEYKRVIAFTNGEFVYDEDFTVIKPYDIEKYKDGMIYEFKTLKDVYEFVEKCSEEIEFTEEFTERFNCWDWTELDIEYVIDSSEDNCMILTISMHQEYRD